jgi:hypothetical protein
LGSVVLFHHVSEVMTKIVGGKKQCTDIKFVVPWILVLVSNCLMMLEHSGIHQHFVPRSAWSRISGVLQLDFCWYWLHQGISRWWQITVRKLSIRMLHHLLLDSTKKYWFILFYLTLQRKVWQIKKYPRSSLDCQWNSCWPWIFL